MNRLDLHHIKILVAAAVKIAVRCGMAKVHLIEIVSDEFNFERNNALRHPTDQSTR